MDEKSRMDESVVQCRLPQANKDLHKDSHRKTVEGLGEQILAQHKPKAPQDSWRTCESSNLFRREIRIN